MAAYNQPSMNALEERAARAIKRLECCELCKRGCRVNRLEDERGFCGTGRLLRVASYAPHMGEEEPLKGHSGSGTIFFSGCSLSCVFCQNHEISQMEGGQTTEPLALASMMLELQDSGCHNINLVTPTHVVPQILEALVFARRAGLCIPLVYNSHGYDPVETLRLLDGIVDIYLPDAKFGSDLMAERYSNAPGYVQVLKSALSEMHRQVGDLVLDGSGIAVRGLLVRHLLLPGDAAGTEEVVRFLAIEISKDTYLNIMDQYGPHHRAYLHPELNRPITRLEYAKALSLALDAGLYRGLAML